jgi:hypothetical protein
MKSLADDQRSIAPPPPRAHFLRDPKDAKVREWDGRRRSPRLVEPTPSPPPPPPETVWHFFAPNREGLPHFFLSQLSVQHPTWGRRASEGRGDSPVGRLVVVVLPSHGAGGVCVCGWGLTRSLANGSDRERERGAIFYSPFWLLLSSHQSRAQTQARNRNAKPRFLEALVCVHYITRTRDKRGGDPSTTPPHPPHALVPPLGDTTA